jgi:hypothetical protein
LKALKANRLLPANTGVAMEFVIEFKNDSYLFEHHPDITHLNETQFLDRCWFIVKNKNNAIVEEYADLWLAWKYHGSTYNQEIMQVLHALDKNVWNA